MAVGFLQLPADSTGKKDRTYEFGTEGHARYQVENTERSVSGVYAAGTFAIAMVASAATQNLATLENTTGSAVLLAVQSVVVTGLRGSTTAYTNVTPLRLWGPGTTVPTGGTTLTKHKLDSVYAGSSANAIARGAASADNTASAITYALPADNPHGSRFYTPTMTGAGQFLTDRWALDLLEYPPLVLRAGESLLVTSQNNQNTSATNFAVEMVWEEFTYV